MKIALAYNKKPEEDILEDDEPPDRYAEYDPPRTIEAITSALESLGHKVFPIEAKKDFLERILEISPDIVFNIAEGLKGESRESQVPAILEWLGIPYTGSDPLTMAITLDKPITKKILQVEGIPTPRFAVVSESENLTSVESLNFPLIVKPSHEGSSMGLNSKSIVYSYKELKERVDIIIKFYHQPALVEEFIEGRELTVGILGNSPPEVLPIKELDFSGVPENLGRFASGEIKAKYWYLVKHYCPAPLDEGLYERIKNVSLKVFKVLRCRDLARLDIRLSKDGTPYVLEINPLPDLDPKEGNFPDMARVKGMSYKELINAILNAGVSRYPNLLNMEGSRER
ncbi:MAG: ATP-grasp domain-containing protein [Dictyoglomi bacterium]|nr:ATP-grasp domain-containing protein [Dictyoglomota bacterium]